MRQDYAQFTARAAVILVICPEDADAVCAYWAREALPMVGLADPGHEVANQFGQEVNLFKLGRMPALAVIDRAGRVRFEHHASGMQDIPTNASVLAVLDRLNAEHVAETVGARVAA